MARICLSLLANTLSENQRILSESSCSFAELRIDYLEPSEWSGIPQFAKDFSGDLILTCRKVCDGGLWPDDQDAKREELLLSALQGGFSFVDLEENFESSKLVAAAKSQNTKIIRSFHDFQTVPADLESRLRAMKQKGDLVKAAVMPQGMADVITLFEIGMNWTDRNAADESSLILLGMGDYGVPTRILAERMNSYLTFCSAKGKSAAPGHMNYQTLHELYRVDQIEKDWDIFAIIGNPVLHTRSPEIHNKGLQNIGRKGVYVPFTVDDVPLYFDLARKLSIQGFSVTVPHKEAVIEHLVKVDDGVKAVGACNTVLYRDGAWEGVNTDIIGFLRPLENLGEIKKHPQGLKGFRTAVLGAGGAARSAVYALVSKKCDVTIFNRTLEKAESLASEMGCQVGSLKALRKGNEKPFDIIVQTTSAGMEGPYEKMNPLDTYSYEGSEVVYDIIYIPEETLFMKDALQAGCSVLGGWPMLVEQGRAQFLLFTGEELPA